MTVVVKIEKLPLEKIEEFYWTIHDIVGNGLSFQLNHYGEGEYAFKLWLAPSNPRIKEAVELIKENFDGYIGNIYEW